MAKTGKISLYNLNLEKTMLDMTKALEAAEETDLLKLKYCLFYPMIGKEYDEKRELIIYGESADDWKPVFKLTKNKAQIEAIVKKAHEQSIVSRGCALDWVNKYWVKHSLYRSFFWNIAQKLCIERYGRNENDWNHIITYSNLLKISPLDVNKMPDTVFNAQLSNVAHLFKEELSLLQPKNVLLMTNFKKRAEPILRKAGIKFTIHDGEYITATTAYRGSRIIISEKPFAGNHRKFLDEVKREMV